MQLRISRADREAERDEVVETCKRQETKKPNCDKLKDPYLSHFPELLLPVKQLCVWFPAKIDALLCLPRDLNW